MVSSSNLAFSWNSPSQLLTKNTIDPNFFRLSLHSFTCLQCRYPNFPRRNSFLLQSMSTAISDKALSDIQISGVIACLRSTTPELAMEAACAALDGGITVLEIVMSTPGVLEVLQHLVAEYPEKTIGVGTVLRAKDANNAVECGAKFLMSPAIVRDVMDYVSETEVLYIPGAMSPSEILSAYNAGAKIVKVYPVSALGGAKYIAAVKKPFPHIPLVASQGITLDSIEEYIAQGAAAVVLSDAIFEKKLMEERDFRAIYELANSAARRARESIERKQLLKQE